MKILVFPAYLYDIDIVVLFVYKTVRPFTPSLVIVTYIVPCFDASLEASRLNENDLHFGKDTFIVLWIPSTFDEDSVLPASSNTNPLYSTKPELSVMFASLHDESIFIIPNDISLFTNIDDTPGSDIDSSVNPPL